MLKKLKFSPLLVISAVIFGLLVVFFIFRDTETDKVKEHILNVAVASYGGGCVCPFNKTARDESCNNRSQYDQASKAGTIKPICYKADITEEMVRSFKSAELSYSR
jgi:hypothetical protein